ncbi:MAG: type II secretion system F family protein [bacterium]|nr:type II secretion system F family protein [bacterium]
MRFSYIASEPSGKIVEGEMEAQGVAEVLEFLAGKGLKPVSVKIVKGVKTGGGGFLSATITETDKIFITKYLGLMLKVGTDLLQAIEVLITDFDKPVVKMFLSEVRANLKKGQPFYLSFAKYPRFFNKVFVNLIKAGEASGNLDKVLEDMSVTLEKQQDIKNRIKGVLIYPIFLLATSFFILFFLVTFALPKIANVFVGGGFKPPLFSRIVFAVGGFFGKYALFLLFFLIIGGIAAFYFYKTSVAFRRYVFNLLNYFPGVRDVINKIALQRFAATLASLIEAGLPLTQGIELTAQAVGNEEMAEALLRISREGITKGLSVSDSFRREAIFPRVVVNLIAISEKAGHIENVLKTLSHFYENETDTSIKFMVSMLEPALLMGMGVVVGTIALSIIVPIYQLTTKF